MFLQILTKYSLFSRWSISRWLNYNNLQIFYIYTTCNREHSRTAVELPTLSKMSEENCHRANLDYGQTDMKNIQNEGQNNKLWFMQ